MDEKETTTATTTAIIETKAALDTVNGRMVAVAATIDKVSSQVTNLRLLVEGMRAEYVPRAEVEAQLGKRLAVEVWQAERAAIDARLARAEASGAKVFAVMLAVMGLELTGFSAAVMVLVNVLTRK